MGAGPKDPPGALTYRSERRPGLGISGPRDGFRSLEKETKIYF